MSLGNNTNMPIDSNSASPVDVNAIATRIEALYNGLSSQASLEPTNEVNQHYSELVEICKVIYPKHTVDAILKHPKVANIQADLLNICSQGECLLEVHWAKKVRDGEAGVDDFIYYNNYEDLVRLELELLRSVNAKLDNVVFVGSGPFPLSSVMLAKQAGTDIKHIDNVEKDAEINKLAGEWVNLMPTTTTFHFHTKDACDYEGYGTADVMILGALVGKTLEEKRAILKKIASDMKQDAVLLIRTAHSLRQLLYAAPDEELLQECGFHAHFTAAPGTDIINSVVIATKSKQDRVEISRLEIQAIRATGIKLINAMFVGSDIYSSREFFGEDIARGEMALICHEKESVHQFQCLDIIDVVILDVKPEEDDEQVLEAMASLCNAAPAGAEEPLLANEVGPILERLALTLKKGAAVLIRSDYPPEELKKSGYELHLRIISHSGKAKSFVIAQPKQAN